MSKKSLKFLDVSHFELAALSNAVYSGRTIGGWQEYHSYGSLEKGYFAIAYRKGNKIAIAHKGTDENNLDDIRNDIKILCGELPPYHESSMKFTEEVSIKAREDSLEIVAHTGHSLGGFLSQLITIRTGVKSVVFDAPGIREMVDNYPYVFNDIANVNLDLSVSYNTAPHLINSLLTHVFPIIRLFPEYELGSIFMIQQHGIENILNQFNPSTGDPYIQGYTVDPIHWPKPERHLNEIQQNVCNRSEFELYLGNKLGGWGFLADEYNLLSSVTPTHNHEPYFRHLEHEYNQDNSVQRHESEKIRKKENKYCTHGLEIIADDTGSNIWGSTACDDTITSGIGNDTIWLFGGNDIIHDYGGHDEYMLVPHFFMKTSSVTYIYDDDKNGKISIDGMNCNLGDAYISREESKYIFEPQSENCEVEGAFSGILENNKVQFLLAKECLFGIEMLGWCDLKIEYKLSDFSEDTKHASSINDHQLVIKDFKNGDLGINLHDMPEDTQYSTLKLFGTLLPTLCALVYGIYCMSHYMQTELLLGKHHNDDGYFDV